MDLNPVEWTQAQDLLRKLVQTLTPLTSGVAPRRSPLSPNSASMGPELIPFNKRLFIPSFGESLPSFPYPVRLLSALRSTQQQMEELIEKLPIAEIHFSKETAAKSLKKITAENTKETAAKPLEKITAEKTEFTEKESVAVQKVPQRSPVSASVSGQAQKIIDQVRDAIGTLSNSANLVDPKAAPLREALKRLKPLVDALIHAVGRGDMPSSEDEASPTFRFAVPKSPREHLFKKEIPIPKGQEPSLRKAATHSWDPPQSSKRRLETPGEVAEKSGSNLKESSQNETKAKIPPQQYPTAGIPPVRPQEDPEIKLAEQTSLPGVPYPSSSFQMQKKEKKKRKGLWSSEKEDDQKSS